MDNDDGKTSALVTTDDIDSRCAVNSLILDYYKKFGKKRDLEQFFSLSTAQSDIRDTSGSFWRRMKSENDSSDSGELKSSAAHELCRISIRCSIPEPSSSHSDEHKTKAESPNTISPPIITEDPLGDIRHTDDESNKSDDNHSQKSYDPLLDLSAHKPLSPSSSITSQRKLEWDSLADVGYTYESERKTSASTLSTLERLALKQQYSNNDPKQDIGSPTCHSTPLDENDSKTKTKRNSGRTTKIIKKDFDFVELNLPHTSDIQPHQSIQVNLTKHISVNVEKDGEVTVDNIRQDVNIVPEKIPDENAKTSDLPGDKENQTLSKTNDVSIDAIQEKKTLDLNSQKIPVMISLNTLRKKMRHKKSVAIRRKFKTRRKVHENKEKPSQEKSGGQLSEAESFEYMPGHIYNQNQLKARDVNESKSNNNTNTGNKSSLESSGGLTTDSSKGSIHSFTKDLEKCIEVLKITLQKRYDDGELKKKLIKEIIQRLITTKYRDDDTSTDFLSGMSFNSKNNDEKSNTVTTSTSDTNNADYSKQERPRKSILRMEKFDSKQVASTSQSVPNLLTTIGSENIDTKLQKRFPYNSGSDESNRWKISSENDVPKTSSEELYLKYLEALKREESYKRQLKDKEMFLKQKLTKSETAIKAKNKESHKNERLKQLMKDLTRNNCDDGSGDASKLEAGSISDRNMKTIGHPVKSQRSHSVFTLSSSFSEPQRKQNIKTKQQCDQYVETGTSRNHYCCCPHHGVNSKIGYCDSSVQVNIQYQSEEESIIKLAQDFKRHCQQCKRNIRHLESEISSVHNQCDICKCHANPNKPDGTSTNYQSCSQLNKCKPCSDMKIYDPMKEPTTVADKRTDGMNTHDCLVHNCKISNRFIEDSSNIMGAGSCKISSNVDRIQVIRAPCTLDNMSTSTNSNYSQRHCKSSQTNLLRKMTCSRKNGNSSDPRNSYGSSIQCALGSEVGKHKTIIHEATRCLQTEISIDPKISDPSLADITIINNCAELIGLNSREVIINTLEEMKTFNDVYTSSESGNLPLKSEDGFFQGEIKESDINIIESKDSNISLTNVLPKDYTIPIKGTNMTLMVSLASSESNQSKQKVNQQVGTEKALIREEGTCVSTECAKSIQCVPTSTNILNNDRESPADFNSNKSSNTNLTSPSKYQSNRSPTRSPPHCNTYPKIVKVKENKLLRRANTDTDKLKTCCAQTESSYQVMPLTEIKPESKVMKGTLKNQEPETNMDEKITRMKTTKDRATLKDTKEIGIQKYLSDDELSKKHSIQIYRESKNIGTEIAVVDKGLEVSCQTDFRYQENIHQNNAYVSVDNIACDVTCKPHGSKQKQCDNCSLKICQCAIDQKTTLKKNTESSSEFEVDNVLKDPIITVIQDITRRYSKGDITKLKKKKCFKEIISVLNYLLETEEISDQEPKSTVSVTPESSDNSKKSLGVKILHHSDGSDIKKTTKASDTKMLRSEPAGSCDKTKKKVLRTSESESLPGKRDKSVQLSSKTTSKCTESSDIPCSTDRPSTSDSTACKIFNKIKKECEKYHMKRKCGRKCEISSSTSVNCEDCKKVHHCGCRHKCKRSKIFDKLQKKCVAYNLILQTSESMLSEDTVCDNKRPLPNIVVKVPKRKDRFRAETCKETIYRIEKEMKDNCSPRIQRSKSCHKDSEVFSNDDLYRTAHCTVREYLEKNRPDFVEKSGERQNCLKFINEIRPQENTSPRLKMIVVHQPACKNSLKNSAHSGGIPMRHTCGSTFICNPNPVNLNCNLCTPNFYCQCNPCNSGNVHTISDMTRIANERAAHRNLLSLQVDKEPDLTNMTSEQLRDLAKQIGLDLRRKKPAPKFISESEMKKHSEKIYKTLPEVVQKKEEKKKENIKKTNLLMANIFKKNLQKKTLGGSVNLSNYSTVIKI